MLLDGEGTRVRQLVRALRAAIADGRLLAGDALPPTRTLARALAISRNTALAAYEQLTAEGLIHGVVGSGSYVCPNVRSMPAPSGRPEGAVPTLSAFGQRALDLAPHRRPATDGRLRYDLSYGTPAVTPAMQLAWRRALVHAADDTAFDYPPINGLPRLRTALAGYLRRRRGLDVEADDILIVGGTQQGIDLCARVLLNPGERAIVEDPCYQGLVQSLCAHGAEVLRVAVDADGLCTDALAGLDARWLAVTPSHQFPTGAALPLTRRLALLDWAERCNTYVIEDDYDGEFRHGGAPLAALKALDHSQRVIYLGSFSRVLFPAARLGYLVLPRALQPVFHAARWLADRGSPAIEQHALAELIATGRFERLLLQSARRLGERQRALLAAIERHLGAEVQVLGAQAGMHLCVWLNGLDPGIESALVRVAAALGVAVLGIGRYCLHPPRALGLLLGYAHLAPTELDEAMRRLRIAIDQVARIPAVAGCAGARYEGISGGA